MKSVLDNLVEGNDNTNRWTSACNTWANAGEQTFHASRPAREQYKQATNHNYGYITKPITKVELREEYGGRAHFSVKL